jgi:hypothetical protein
MIPRNIGQTGNPHEASGKQYVLVLDLEIGSKMSFRNAGRFSTDFTVLYSRWQNSSSKSTNQE